MRIQWGFRILFAAILLVTWAGGLSAAERAKAWEGGITIPTYPLGPEDLNPRFPVYEGGIIYPYTTQDELTTEKVDKTWRAVFLENEYLRVTCLPDIGSRLHSVFDKTTNEEMFDTNEVIKPGLIGLRGAWVSGGVEWNAGPQSHTVTSFSPCDAWFRENKDGSATLFAGNTDMVTRTRWTVELTLRPGKAYLEERIRIENPGDTPQPYYFWNNAAFPCHEGVRFIYPMTLGCDHAGREFFTWPIHEGKDISWLKNYDQPTSIFAYECEFDFFGAYDAARDRGIVQVADHNVLVGKKAWTWGMSDDGTVSMASLTDDGSRYIEVQSGPLATQAQYELLMPHQRIEWEEWWYPVHGLGEGFEYATKDVCAEVIEKGGGALELRLIATGKYPNALVRVTHGATPVSEKRVDLSPAGPVSLPVALPQGADCLIEILDRDGATLAAFEAPLPIPVKVPPELPQEKPAADKTAQEHYWDGLLHYKQLNPRAARESYLKALELDPGYTDALRELAVLDLNANLLEDAAKRLERVVARNPNDGMAWRYLGVARLRQDNVDGALKAAYAAVRTLDAASTGYDLAGRAWMRKNEYARALDAFERAIALNPHDTRARDHRLVALLRVDAELARTQSSHEIAVRPLEIVPYAVHHFAHAALDHSRDPGQALGAEPFQGMLGENVYLARMASLDFAELGAWEEAMIVLGVALDRPGESALEPALLAYYAAKRGEEPLADTFVAGAKGGPFDYMFPSHPAEEGALRFVIQRDPSRGWAHYALGNLLAGLYREDEAVEHWRKAVELDPSLNVAHRNLGLHAWKKDKDLDAAAAHYRDAIAARPEDQTLYFDVAEILMAADKRGEAIALLEDMSVTGRKRPDCVSLLTEAYIDEGRFDAALDLLAQAHYSNWEGNTRSWNLFKRAHMERGQKRMDAGQFAGALEDFQAALTYPKNLGVGRPARAQEADAYYWQGMALKRLGKAAEARAAFEAGAGNAGKTGGQQDYREKCEKELAQM